LTYCVDEKITEVLDALDSLSQSQILPSDFTNPELEEYIYYDVIESVEIIKQKRQPIL